MNKKETNILKKAYKKEDDGKIKERILMMRYSYEGKTSREVGEMLQCDQKLVLYWKNRYEKEGLAGLKTRQKSGKPMLLSRRQEARIKEQISENDPANPWATKGDWLCWCLDQHSGRGLLEMRDEDFGKKILCLKRKYSSHTLFCEDESTFLYDSISRKIWVQKGSKPRRIVTGLHKRTHIFGFLS